MRTRILAITSISLMMQISSALALASETSAAQNTERGASEWFVYIVIAVVFIAIFTAFGAIRNAVSNSNFRLSEALSEESDITLMETDSQGNRTPCLGKDNKPISVTVLVGSTSRVIALVGMISILMLFLGFGALSMYYFGSGKKFPAGMDEIIKFIVAGITLFAPYTVNKFAKLFRSVTKEQ
jgi:hypothetical protein